MWRESVSKMASGGASKIARSCIQLKVHQVPDVSASTTTMTTSHLENLPETNHTERHEIPEGAEGLDNPLRAIIVVNLSESPEGDLEERMLDGIQSFEEVELFFDQFDEQIAYPNEKDIKYEVGSDGLVVFVVSTLKLRDQVTAFLEAFSKKGEGAKERGQVKEQDPAKEQGQAKDKDTTADDTQERVAKKSKPN